MHIHLVHLADAHWVFRMQRDSGSLWKRSLVTQSTSLKEELARQGVQTPPECSE